MLYTVCKVERFVLTIIKRRLLLVLLLLFCWLQPSCYATSHHHHHQLTFLEWPKYLTLLQGPLYRLARPRRISDTLISMCRV